MDQPGYDQPEPPTEVKPGVVLAGGRGEGNPLFQYESKLYKSRCQNMLPDTFRFRDGDFHNMFQTLGKVRATLS